MTDSRIVNLLLDIYGNIQQIYNIYTTYTQHIYKIHGGGAARPGARSDRRTGLGQAAGRLRARPDQAGPGGPSDVYVVCVLYLSSVFLIFVPLLVSNDGASRPLPKPCRLCLKGHPQKSKTEGRKEEERQDERK